jgi:hypothetical protein
MTKLSLNEDWAMQFQPVSRDRRCFPERRFVEKGPPPGVSERRVRAERRGFEVIELDFDERIALGGERAAD